MKFRSLWLMLLLFGTSIVTCASPNILRIITSTLILDTTKMLISIASKDMMINQKNFTELLTNYHSTINLVQNAMLNSNSIILSTYKKRDTGQNYAVPPCYKFEIGDPDTNVFYSPNYPNNYPKNIDCVRIIEAPDDRLIRLDFRNSFKIEDKEECKFDYLEIRDGPYGYSNEIGKFCGEKFPEIITSKGRHLWLHFHSDESIEYSGFTIVYEFIKKKDGAIIQELNCTIQKDGPDGFINSTDVPADIMERVKTDKIPLDCMWVVKVREGWKIQIKFLKFSLEKPNDCDVNFVDIFKENTDMNSRIKNFCGSAGDSVPSETNVLHVRFFADLVAIKSEFSILYTAFREKTTNCEEDEYDCEDATCISADLKCNNRDNCKFRWDEDGCDDQEKSQSEHVVIIIIVFVLILGGMVITFLVNCIRKLLKDQKIIREHIRQSKESKLNEMGRISAMRSKENLAIKLSPRERHSQGSFQILDDVSNRYYREIVPISTQNSKNDLKKNDSILRQHRDITIQTNLEDDILPSSDHNTCEMACQTRESLFQPIIRQKSTPLSSSSNQSIAAIRFSTFGYDTLTLPTSTTANKYDPKKQDINKSRIIPNTIETTATEILHQPFEVCHHHHQHQQHLKQQQTLNKQQQQSSSSQQHPHRHHCYTTNEKEKQQQQQQQKIDESKVFIDIRNSAPDVIIMTSH